MKSGWPLLTITLLLTPAYGEEDATPPMSRERLEGIGQFLEWKKMEFKEDDVLLVGGTCDVKQVEETFGLCRKAIDKACAALRVPPEQLRGGGKLWFTVLSEKKEFMSLADTPKQKELYDRISAAGNFMCIDPAAGMTPDGIPHMTAHLFTHRILEAYQKLHPGTEPPGWLKEGFPAWMDGTLNGTPKTCCIAHVGYEDENFKTRQAGASWEESVTRALQKYSETKESDRHSAEYTPLRNLVGKPFDRLTGTDVAVSWKVIGDLISDKAKPEGFKALLDAVLEGGKQPLVFEKAFGKSLDDYEKGWMKAILPKPEPPAPKKKKK